MPTSQTARGSRALLCLLTACGVTVGLAATASPARAQAEDSAAVEKVTKMNKRAVEEYDNLNFEEARKILKDALDFCAQNGLDKHPIKARTHVHLGVVILAGFKQRDLAIKQFRKALEIEPEIKLTKSMANPEIQEAFDEAVAAAKSEKPDVVAGGEGDKTKAPPAEGLQHEPVTRATQGQSIPIGVTIDPALGAKKVVVAYWPAGASDFVRRELREVTPGNWAGEIPPAATSGSSISYYIEAQGEDGTPVATKASATDPIVVAVRGVGAPKPPKAPGGGEEDEMHWYLALAIGSGVGWTTGTGDVHPENKVTQAGFALAQLGHLAPEVGYFVTPALLLSVQARLQLVTGATPQPAPDMTQCGPDHICSPAKNAVAVLARASWFFGDSSFRPYVGGAAGGGNTRPRTALPLVFHATATTEMCVDTVSTGPLFVGGGGGFIYDLTDNFGLTAGLTTLFGFPDFTFNVDINAGVSAQF